MTAVYAKEAVLWS